VIDSNFTSALRTAKWLHTTYVRQPEKIKRHLSIVAFATPNTSSYMFKQRIQAEETIQIQEMLQEHSNKMLKKSTELYTGGDLGTAQAIQEMVANFYMIMNLLIHRFNESELWKSISAEHEKAIKSDAGRQFFRRFDLEKQIHLNVIGDIQDILSAFTVLGTHSQLRDAVAAGTTIDPATLEEPINHSCLVTTNFNTLLKRGSPAGLDHVPVFADVFPQLELNKNKKDHATDLGIKKQANKEKPTPDQQRGRDAIKMQRNEKPGDTTNQQQSVELQKKGFLVWSGQGEPPECPVRIKLKNMATKERICTSFISQGAACKYGRKCQHVHLVHLKVLNDAEKAKMDEFVNTTQGLAYAETNPGTNNEKA
jgi:hypothetical protein